MLKLCDFCVSILKDLWVARILEPIRHPYLEVHALKLISDGQTSIEWAIYTLKCSDANASASGTPWIVAQRTNVAAHSPNFRVVRTCRTRMRRRLIGYGAG